MVLGAEAELIEIPAEIESDFRSKGAREILKIYNS